jgi:glutamate 5-kinase
MTGIIVVKLGSSSVTKVAGPDHVLLSSTLKDAIEAQRLGWHVVLVSSGAVSSGSAHLSSTLKYEASSRLSAAVGQPLLMNKYSEQVTEKSHVLGQVLVSQSDLRSAVQMRVVSEVLQECFKIGIVPLVNGNDVTDADGSDNDSVAAGIAISVGADKLLLLTDVDGVYRGLPGASERYHVLTVGDLHDVRFARSGTGRGGMRSKLRAAELASHNGVETTITNAGHANAILTCIRSESLGTKVPATSASRPPDKRWIAGIARSHGRLVINREAEESIRRGSSLFASGIKRVYGDFEAGDVIDISTPNGKLVARGGANASSRLLHLVRAMQSAEVGMVMAEIIYQFAAIRSSTADEEEIFSKDEPRWSVKSALETVRTCPISVKRRLAIELLELFPDTAVSCMTDTSKHNGRHRLAEFYGRLSSDLSFIDRSRLVVF